MPEKHFPRDLDRPADFSFVYELVEPLYSPNGRRSIDPVAIVKMMMLGYLHGINSERRLEQEVHTPMYRAWLIDGKLLLTDSTHVRANVRDDVKRVMADVEPSAYLRRLHEQAKREGIYPKERENEVLFLIGTQCEPIENTAGTGQTRIAASHHNDGLRLLHLTHTKAAAASVKVFSEKNDHDRP